MTGEPDELKKEPLEVCKLRQEERDLEFEMGQGEKKAAHDLPSPVLLSGT
jgi:hypothetical protein